MSKGCYHLGEMTAGMIRFYCPECHRFAQLQLAKLLEQFGPGKPMPTMLRDLKPCDIGDSLSGPQCQLRYWDCMTGRASRSYGQGWIAGELLLGCRRVYL
jgi:hypothetical protein